jgi:hypothetical protein
MRLPDLAFVRCDVQRGGHGERYTRPWLRLTLLRRVTLALSIEWPRRG